MNLDSTFYLMAFLIFIISVVMTMVGKGGGNFYVLLLTLFNVSIYEAATTGQFILFTASLAAFFIFKKKKSVLWQLAILMAILISIPAFLGGYLSHLFTDFSLKLLFSSMLILTGIIILFPIKKDDKNRKFGIIEFNFNDIKYKIDLLFVVPITMATGLISGMIGVSGGSFLVPLMVITCSIPIQIAIGTSSILIMITSFMGFAGHAISGNFNPKLAIPLSIITITGGIIGSRFTLKTDPGLLKKIFAYTNWLAAGLMLLKLFKI